MTVALECRQCSSPLLQEERDAHVSYCYGCGDDIRAKLEVLVNKNVALIEANGKCLAAVIKELAWIVRLPDVANAKNRTEVIEREGVMVAVGYIRNAIDALETPNKAYFAAKVRGVLGPDK